MDYLALHEFFMNSRIQKLFCEIQLKSSEEKLKVIIISTPLGSFGVPNSETTFSFSLTEDENKIFTKKYDDLTYYKEII